MKRTTVIRFVSAIIFVLASHLSVSVHAAKIFNTYNLDGQKFDTEGPHNLKITKDGKLKYFFRLRKDSLVMFNLTAECTMGGSTSTWVVLRIFVDGKALPQMQGTKGGTAFCSGNGDSTNVSWVSGAISGMNAYEKGRHSVQVKAKVWNGSSTLRLDDINLNILSVDP